MGGLLSHQGQFGTKYPRAISPSLHTGPQWKLEIDMITACWPRVPIDSLVAVKQPCLGRAAANRR